MQRQFHYAQQQIVRLPVVQLTLQVAVQLACIVLQCLVRTAQLHRDGGDLLQFPDVAGEEFDFAFDTLQSVIVAWENDEIRKLISQRAPMVYNRIES